MKRIAKRARVLVVALSVVAAFAVVASPAMAELVPAKLSSTNNLKVTTSGITLKKGASSWTCTASKALTGAAIEGKFWVTNETWFPLKANYTCTGATSFQMNMVFDPLYDTVTGAYSLRFFKMEPNLNTAPWGNYVQNGTPSGPWTNGTVSTPSTVSFTEAKIGEKNLEAVTISGTYTVTTSTGGLVTLSH